MVNKDKSGYQKLTHFSDEEYINIHNQIFLSGRYNFEGCKISLDSNLNIDFFRFMLKGYKDEQICEFLEYGFPIGYSGKLQMLQSQLKPVRNHKGAKMFPVQISKYLAKEKRYHAIVGPFKENPFCCSAAVSPLNTVPKKSTDDRRIILDLSYPKGNSVNDSINKDWYLGERVSLSFPKVDELVEIIKIKGKGCLLFKKDMARYYRQILIDPMDASLLGFSFNQRFYWDKVLSMGLRSSAHIAQRVSDSIKYMCFILGILIINYIDDLAGAECMQKAAKAYQELGNLLYNCGLEESVSKACSPCTKMIFLGTMFDTEELTLSITSERLQEILLLVDQWLQKTHATLHELQSLIGKLQFVSNCVKPSRIFICRLLNWLRQIHATEMLVPIPPDFRKDLVWWKNFLPRYNGVSMMDMDEFSEPDSVISTDACLRGCGGWFAGRYFHSDFPLFIKEQELHINALEMLTIVVALKLWGPLLRHQKMIVFCDNLSTVRILHSGYTRNEFLQACLREICYIAAIYEFQLKAKFISGIENRISDYLSRWEISEDYEKLFLDKVRGQNLCHYKLDAEIFRFSHDW